MYAVFISENDLACRLGYGAVTKNRSSSALLSDNDTAIATSYQAVAAFQYRT